MLGVYLLGGLVEDNGLRKYRVNKLFCGREISLIQYFFLFYRENSLSI